MKSKAWVHQVKSQVEKHGADKASWYVSWRDPNGKLCCKSCGPGKIGLTAAKAVANTTHSQLVTNTYQTNRKSTWAAFFSAYKEHVEERYKPRSQTAALISIETFVRIAEPRLMRSITTQSVDSFISKRLKEKIENKKRGTVRDVSPATVNRELRYVRAALRLAAEWGYLSKVPRFKLLKVPEKLPTFVTPEHFAAIIEACKVATIPSGIPNVSAEEWWKGLLVLLYMVGWRISQTLAVHREDVDVDQQTILSRAEDNKGGRDQKVPLHPLAIEYLRPLLGSFDPLLFPWTDDGWSLWTEFGRIQEAAKLSDGSPLPKAGKGGRWYGFHDLRRGFATMNAANLNLFQLQSLMQHKSLITTQGYVNMAAKVNQTVANLFVPNLRATENA